ncbi:TetR/AcrR family transcriptional regulator [Burkholderia sp. Ac-20353]|uniref:TetR/AcrR family transcriptional regulator n=1 Tax=Burkholderia sp. Ac-20353 TaxID=2703894 RepID=UPI00197B680D|nr:TetR/AcrR family transcriptional regulator [Burkholderia sp. Ac-20353]MBN3791158.1 TetR/AcrR family transcriptional regulator [Burkholderia sp. Ac-20353]
MRTQAERSTSTRELLIKAAIALLNEQGYAAFGEARVCELAGVSRGALRYHFPGGRYDLLPAVVAYLIDYEATWLEALGPMSATVRFHLLLHTVLRRGRRHPPLAMFEIWMAARGDARLSEGIEPLLAAVPKRVYGMEPHDHADPELLALQMLLQGLAVQCSGAHYDRDQAARAVECLLNKLTPPKELPELLVRIESL